MFSFAYAPGMNTTDDDEWIHARATDASDMLEVAPDNDSLLDEVNAISIARQTLEYFGELDRDLVAACLTRMRAVIQGLYP